MTKLTQVIEKLANGETLEPEYCDHALAGNYQGYRDCHIEPDWFIKAVKPNWCWYVQDHILICLSKPCWILFLPDAERPCLHSHAERGNEKRDCPYKQTNIVGAIPCGCPWYIIIWELP